jgi:hypothetical protein
MVSSIASEAVLAVTAAEAIEGTGCTGSVADVGSGLAAESGGGCGHAGGAYELVVAFAGSAVGVGVACRTTCRAGKGHSSVGLVVTSHRTASVPC